jgi:hypothetical protein
MNNNLDNQVFELLLEEFDRSGANKLTEDGGSSYMLTGEPFTIEVIVNENIKVITYLGMSNLVAGTEEFNDVDELREYIQQHKKLNAIND